MTPKEKAKELIEKFMNYVEMKDFYGDDKELYNAKQCALICVEEIINDNPNIYDSDRLNHKYWKTVLTQIQNYE